MALSKLDNLYRQVILDHAQHPHHHGTLIQTTGEVELKNPTCGDVLKLSVQIEKGQITDLAFSGDGCTISQASASMMTDAVLGKSIREAESMVEIFSMMLTTQQEVTTDQLGDAAILVGVKQFPARIKCATLAWKALHKAMDAADHEAVMSQIMNHEDKGEDEQ